MRSHYFSVPFVVVVTIGAALAPGCGNEEPVDRAGRGGVSGAATIPSGGQAGEVSAAGGSVNAAGGSAGSASGSVPGIGGVPPGTGGTAPGTGGAPPAAGGTAPGTGGEAPATGGTAPGTGGDSQGTGGDSPATGGTAPGTGGDSQGTGGDSPATGGAGGAPVTGEFGFDYRLPQAHTLYCEGVDPPLEQSVADSDWLCTFDHLGTSGVLYVQSTPVSCMFRYSVDTEFLTQAWMSIDGQVTELAPATYDWGSFHHIDFLTFEWDGRTYEYGHSSFSDNRICHPMDCMTVFDAAGATVLEDGCTADRTLPVVCVPMNLDGTHLDLTDYFVSCEQKESDPAFWCERSGGTVETTFCCSGYDDFAETCISPLSCTCTAHGSRDVSVCTCPEGTCFDGRECVLDLN